MLRKLEGGAQKVWNGYTTAEMQNEKMKKNVMNPIKRYVLWLMLLANIGSMSAQRMSVSAPSRVAAGENFRIAYTVNTQNVDDFRSGNIPAAIEVIAGPYTSSQSSFQMINGHTSSSSSVTFTYTLYATKNGTYTISPARAVVNGKTIASTPIKINIVGTAKPSNGAPRMHDEGADETEMRTAGSRISGSDLFIKVSANKKRVHEQEPVLLTYKVYTTVELTQLEGKMPDLNGFHTQEVKLPQQKSFHLEKVNGRNYKCVTWNQYVMYPQMSGEMKIPSIKFKGIVVQRNRNVDPFEAMFNGGAGYVEMKKDIDAPGFTLKVDPLPARPTGFSGGVGTFTISAQLDKQEVKTGDPINLRVVVSGLGNLKLLKAPVAHFPKNFDRYDVKTTDKTQLTVNGIEGNMIYDFLAVPQQIGKYQIPPVEFIYYDIQTQRYRTIKTTGFELKVEKGSSSKSEMSSFEEEREKDIRPILTGPAELRTTHLLFFASPFYLLSLVSIIVLAAAAFIFLHRHRALYADAIRLRGSRANKVAVKRLKQASQLMARQRQNEFYDEVLHALWGYIGDKLSISAEELTRENIAQQLALYGIRGSVVESFLAALDECEFERYAPGDAQGNMEKTYQTAMRAIMDIEATMKSKQKHRGAMLLLLLLAVLPITAQTVTKETADRQYRQGNYQQAIASYKEILKQGVAPEVYYNLGNAYFRADSLTRAILSYERAQQLAPGNADIRFNLQFARSRTIDKFASPEEMFFFTWYRAAVNLMGSDGWAGIALLSLALLAVGVLLFRFSTSIVWRKVGFGGALFFAPFFLLANLFAWQQRRMWENRTGAIVVSPSVTVKKTPSRSGADETTLHEGTRVDIADRTLRGWFFITLPDGREGWIPTPSVEEI